MERISDGRLKSSQSAIAGKEHEMEEKSVRQMRSLIERAIGQ